MALPESRLDVMYILIASFMIHFMQAGFSLLETGVVRTNIRNIILKNIVQLCAGAITWWAAGYAISSGNSYPSNAFFGWDGDAFFQIPRHEGHLWIFGHSFAVTATAVVSGAMAERTRFVAYAWFSAYMNLIVYSVVSHWVWNQHGIFRLNSTNPIGVIDLAGDASVHCLGGATALVGAWMVGPRANWKSTLANTPLSRLHLFSLTKWRTTQLTLQTLGTVLLFCMWFFFNTASLPQLAVDFNATDNASRVATTTLISGSAGGLATMFITYISTRKVLVEPTLNGVLAGLVAVTASAAVIHQWAAFIIGIVGAFCYVNAARAVQWMNVDDPVEAVAVHWAAGAWGLLAAGLFYDNELVELVHGADVANRIHRGQQFGSQLLCIVCVTGWALVTALFGFWIIKVALGGLSDKNADESTHTQYSDTSAGLQQAALFSSTDGNQTLFSFLSTAWKNGDMNQEGINMQEWSSTGALGSEGFVGRIVSGDLCLMFIDVEGCTALLETDPDIGNLCVLLYTNIVRASALEHGGYDVCRTPNGSAHFLVFRDAAACLRCALDVQDRLMRAPWPKALLKLRYGEIAVDAQDRVILKGLRAKVGIHAGPVHVQFPNTAAAKSGEPGDQEAPRVRQNGAHEHSPQNQHHHNGNHSTTLPEHEMSRVYGQHVNIAARICTAAGGGEILVSRAVISRTQMRGLVLLDDPSSHGVQERVAPEVANLADVELGLYSMPHVIKPFGWHSVDGVSSRVELFQLFPQWLAGRTIYFARPQLMFTSSLLERMQLDRVIRGERVEQPFTSGSVIKSDVNATRTSS